MALSPDGNLLITSDVTGTLSIWMIPEFRLTYKLEFDDLVTDLAFTADETRFCDIRGSFCNIWESETLVRANEIDDDDMSNNYETLTSEPTVSTGYRGNQHGAHAAVSAITHGPLDDYYACGFEDGSVSIYSIENGKKERNKVMCHEDTVSVINLAWPSPGDNLATADDSSRIIIKRLQRPSKHKPKWAVFGVFDFRTDDAIEQILFSHHGDLMLVSCPQMIIVLSLKAKEVCRRKINFVEGATWLTNPMRPTAILRADSSSEIQYSWATLEPLESDQSTSSVSQRLRY